MSKLALHLLGKPRVECDGEQLPGPRGNKPWALLAYALCAERPPTRDELVSLLFSEADDPLGALRWNLSALRGALPGTEIEGNPLRVILPAETSVDVATVTTGSWFEAVTVPDLERELLEGIAFPSSPAFEIWLLTQRRHLGALAEGVLREAALARLGAGDSEAATDFAARLVRLNPLDENFQALFIRCLAASGDGVEAARQVARCKELFRRELGIEPSSAVVAASRVVEASPTASPVSGRAEAKAQLDAGEAAIAAGAFDAGVDCLRRSVAAARFAAAVELQARALLALGSALVHAARGRDEEAAAALHAALAAAERAGVSSVGAAASRELGWIEALRGRCERAEAWLLKAADLAVGDPAEQGRIAGVLGVTLSDRADYGRAADRLHDACRLSGEAGDRRQVSYHLGMLGRLHLLRGELGEARDTLDESIEGARAENWTAFRPWPEALRAEVDLMSGEIDSAADRFEDAFALGCQLGDPCWEGAAARGVGLVAAARGELQSALNWLADARQRSSRFPDAYLWVELYTLESLCSLAVENALPAAPSWIDELADLSARTGMREFAVRAYVYRGQLGDDSATTAARMLAGGIDNPALTALLATPEVA